MLLARALDLLALATALMAAWLWFRASSTVMRRVSKAEDFDHHDLNRVIVALNRSQTLNRRAALATAASALAIVFKLANDLLTGG